MLASVLFCQCGSGKVDINHWINRTTPVIRCYECDCQVEVKGFTVGRAYVDDRTTAEARGDRAAMRWPLDAEIVEVAALGGEAAE